MDTVRVKIDAEPFIFAVFSDTHGSGVSLLPGIAMRMGVSAIIHLGDYARDVAAVPLPKYAVSGNCDFSSACPGELLLEIGAARVFLAHGHTYAVKNGPKRLIEKAESLGAGFALYGHTHIADIYNAGSVIAANPGSLTQPRSFAQGACYGKLIYDKGRLDFEVVRD